MTKIDFSFEIVGLLDSERLWNRICFAEVSLFVMENTVFIFGHTDMDTFNLILKVCSSFGKLEGGEFSCG